MKIIYNGKNSDIIYLFANSWDLSFNIFQYYQSDTFHVVAMQNPVIFLFFFALYLNLKRSVSNQKKNLMNVCRLGTRVFKLKKKKNSENLG